jgi:thioredoxin-like negative regulator of GroEL
MSVLAQNRPAPTTALAETRTGTARPLLCFVYSPTSGPSRRAEGFLAQVLQRRKNHQTFLVQRINCVDRPDLAKKLGAETVPSLVVVENRRVRARLERVSGCKEIEHLLEPWLGAPAGEGSETPPPDEATPPSPASVPEPYPPDELDLPSPGRGEDGGDE